MSCSPSNSPEREPSEARTASGRFPSHNWRPTVVHGALLWALLLAVGAPAPTGHPLSLGVSLVAVFAAPVLPVALFFDYRQARRVGTCDSGLVAYLGNLAWDVRTLFTRGDPLGSARREFDSR
ncbi:hypothetical protein [Haloarcula nitratireducens]|uniref:Uncharacterized protein n=1 Tax=Haloarcula nitratireducens TaxID=2487749 RepID=A0AAW4PIT4_9EURY|nr:hypothetical protein [Halomicroarcula nitratireducens]MBX0297132.1 hypothetical protein [Halomicroarcula nitratireducens]